MKLLIIGGVAGGATAAARARRLSESAEITLLERGPYVSFANCGLPYYLSGDIVKRSSLLLQTPEGLEGRYRVQAHVNTEALEIDRKNRRVRAVGPDGERWFAYDRLILAQGGNPVVPPLPGSDAAHVFRLWTVPDMDRIQKHLLEGQPRSAVIVGGGFIGLEAAEALSRRGLQVSIVELAPQILTTMDREFGERARRHLDTAGIGVRTGASLAGIETETKTVRLSDGSVLDAELVLFSVGVRPELTLARQAGLVLGESGGLLVDSSLQTSDPHIWAAGDMVEVVQKVSGRKTRVPLAGPANRQGRIAATNALGGRLTYQGALGTAVVKLIDATAASTGLTEKAARDAGFDVGSAIVHKDHHASYFPGGKTLTLKLVYERPSGRLLGAQAFGAEGVDKRIDVVATALLGRLTVHDLAELDLAYAPPYSSANDPLNLAAFVAENDLSGFSPLITAEEAARTFDPATHVIVDVRNLGEYAKGHVPGALHIPVDELRAALEEGTRAPPREKTLYVHCAVGFRAHLAVRILKDNGYERVFNITGGYTSMKAVDAFAEE